MNEVLSKKDSPSALWGEIEIKADSAANFWKPILEYQNVITHERNFSSLMDFSENTFETEIEKKHLNYDPIGQHLIKLRKCFYDLSDLIGKVQRRADYDRNYKQKLKGARKKRKYTRKPFPPFFIPEFPVNYPFSDSSKALVVKKPEAKIPCRGILLENQAKKQIVDFAKQVLAQTGFYVEDLHIDSFLIKSLADITDKFLTGFVNHMRLTKDCSLFSESDDLWGPLETTLHDIGFHGIHGLHNFYYNRVIEKHDNLLQQCQDMLQKYEELKKLNAN